MKLKQDWYTIQDIVDQKIFAKFGFDSYWKVRELAKYDILRTVTRKNPVGRPAIVFPKKSVALVLKSPEAVVGALKINKRNAR